ncbi:MBL fold metallo-hydrolase [Desulfovirgula thermocuniculi]|uniref:MBL fold metallo-hydrolase n=1 Tax=Desulfovirgula thermocuniculi TaxID=348842 RepID=UPI0003FAB796|nr:MBL fold metallo-hydrolase [Desulfovirgula thermocuniculi]
MSLLVEGVEVIWLGHASFLLKGGGKTVATDPYNLKSVPAKADLVLVSHDHFDHCDVPSVRLVAGADAMLLAPSNAVGKLQGLGTFREVKPGDEVAVKGLRIKVVPAYNVRAERQNFHPRTYGGVGYLLELAGKIIYHPGDTDVIPEMDSLGKVDIALLPVSGVYVMDAEEAAEAVRRIKPAHAVPMHYGAGVAGTRDDAEKFARLAGGLTRVHILDPVR